MSDDDTLLLTAEQRDVCLRFIKEFEASARGPLTQELKASGVQSGDAEMIAANVFIAIGAAIACDAARNQFGREPEIERWRSACDEHFNRYVKSSVVSAEVRMVYREIQIMAEQIDAAVQQGDMP